MKTFVAFITIALIVTLGLYDLLEEEKMIESYKKAIPTKMLQTKDEGVTRPQSSDRDLNCSDADIVLNDIYAYEKALKLLNKSVFGVVKQLHLPEKAELELFQNFGGKIIEYRKSDSQLPLSFTSLTEIDYSKGAKPLTHEDLVVVIGAYESDNYTKLLELVDELKITQQSLVGGRPFISSIIHHKKQIPVSILEKLYKNGVRVSIFDLYTATIEGLGSNELSRLYSFFEGDINYSWKGGLKSQNLLTTAIRSKNLEAIEYWSEKGVDTEFQDDTLNAMDEVIENMVDLSHQQLDAMINILYVRLGETPADRVNYEKFVQLLNSKQFEDMGIGKPVPINNELFVADAKLEELSNRIREKRNRLDNELRRKNDLNNKCKSLQLTSITEIKNKPQIEGSPSTNYIVANILADSQSENWDNVIDTYLKLANSANEDGIISFAILDLIEKRAPSEKIIDIVSRGYLLDELTIFSVIERDDVKLAENLLPYGLKVEDIQLNGETPEQYSRRVNKLESFFSQYN